MLNVVAPKNTCMIQSSQGWYSPNCLPMPNHHYWAGGRGGLIMAVAIRVTRWFENKKQITQLKKVAQKVSKPQNGKISTLKLHLKVQIMYIKQILKPWNMYNKSCFETDYLGENVMNLLKHKVAKNVAISLGYIILAIMIFSKWPNGQKIAQSWHFRLVFLSMHY